MPQGKGTYGSKVGRPRKKGMLKKAKGKLKRNMIADEKSSVMQMDKEGQKLRKFLKGKAKKKAVKEGTLYDSKKRPKTKEGKATAKELQFRKSRLAKSKAKRSAKLSGRKYFNNTYEEGK
tara:strand:+ start:77 stop:436 length:360 start_codon:yes stop_codon:yes gene_type:complete